MYFVFYYFASIEVLLAIDKNNNNADNYYNEKSQPLNDDDDDESNNYDNKDLHLTPDIICQKIKEAAAYGVNKNRKNSVSGGEYYDVNLSTTNDDLSSSSSNSKGTKIKFCRKKSEPETTNTKNQKKSSITSLKKEPSQDLMSNNKSITDYLIQFFKKRPTADQLKQRGILQGTFSKKKKKLKCN